MCVFIKITLDNGLPFVCFNLLCRRQI